MALIFPNGVDPKIQVQSTLAGPSGAHHQELHEDEQDKLEALMSFALDSDGRARTARQVAERTRWGTFTVSFNNSSMSEIHTFNGVADFGTGGAYRMVIPIVVATGVPTLSWAQVGGSASSVSLRAYHEPGPLNTTYQVNYVAYVTIPGLTN